MTERIDTRDLRAMGAFAIAQGELANPTLAASNSLKPANVVKLTDEILAMLDDTDAFTATHIQLAHSEHVLAGVKQQLTAADRLAEDRGIQIDQMIESMKVMEATEEELLLENKKLKAWSAAPSDKERRLNNANLALTDALTIAQGQIKAFMRENGELKRFAKMLYKADGSFELLDRPSTVIEKRIECAKKLAKYAKQEAFNNRWEAQLRRILGIEDKRISIIDTVKKIIHDSMTAHMKKDQERARILGLITKHTVDSRTGLDLDSFCSVNMTSFLKDVEYGR